MSPKLPSHKQSADVRSFLERLSGLPTVKARPQLQRLVFAMDATASREATWRSARQTQSEMFDAAARTGGIEIQLCYYRGLDEFHTGGWTASTADLQRDMARVTCSAGYTQIARTLQHVEAEARAQRLRAFVFVGDCLEEPLSQLTHRAGALALLGVRAFMFQEGHDPVAEQAFRRIAEVTRGAYCRFDSSSAAQLRELLGAVAAYAAGGLTALEGYGTGRSESVLQITRQIKQQ